MARITKRKGKAAIPRVPDATRGPSPDPTTNLLIGDILMRGGTTLARLAIEKALVRSRYNPQAAKQILASQTLGRRIFSANASRLATRSLPGALLIGTGLMAKALLDRARARRRAKEAPASPSPAQGKKPDVS
ncbi:hypothetical protein MB02_10880 [Croceicoccus estronivorus]|uniref:hypothetical protein n=1 Tax=Croceicoccus estronivorus TaxID=1172626 RepID=UPI00082E12BD|nr:hypothetical protein [Croceicoccus estronivorus]OCC23661.1 hypothetical protein MB02_10880 [Croceicoccus estronivorus]